MTSTSLPDDPAEPEELTVAQGPMMDLDDDSDLMFKGDDALES